MRILHVLPQLSPGGMENLAIQLAQDAVRSGDEVTVASAPGPWLPRLGQAGAGHVALSANSRHSALAMAAATAQLSRCVARLRPAIVHAHNVRATAMSWLALSATRQRAVLVPTLHGVHPADYASASWVLRHASPRVITCAPSVRRSLAAAGFPSGRIDVITNGARLLPASPPRQEELRQRLDLGRGPLVLGIGRLVAQKNWPVFIDAAGHVPDAAFAIAGDGPLLAELGDLARRCGGRVRLLGVVDDIAALVGLSACIVFTSSWEGLPLALLEALSLGAPVVATAVDGVTDLVPPDAAILVPPGDPCAVSNAVSSILMNARLADGLRKRAQVAAAAWRPEEMLRQYRTAYRAALAGQPRWA